MIRESNAKARVVVSKNGPYLVPGGIPLTRQTIVTDADGGSQAWREDETFATKSNYALCRCGQSKTKPFCDGAHAKVGFDGTETASREPYLTDAKRFDGPRLVLVDAERLCASGRFCDPKGSVWSQVAHSDDPKVRQTFLRQVANCPGGRVVAWDKAADAAIEPELPPSIGLVEDPQEGCSGPIWLRGGLPVVSADGFEYEVRNRATLCRCGQSKNKPFCDGSHAQVKFRS
jgi:CDGSH-type Zn-finger protein